MSITVFYTVEQQKKIDAFLESIIVLANEAREKLSGEFPETDVPLFDCINAIESDLETLTNIANDVQIKSDNA